MFKYLEMNFKFSFLKNEWIINGDNNNDINDFFYFFTFSIM
jgi:hypothetical protein